MIASNSRTKKTIVNIAFGFLGQFSNQIMAFIVRTVFINTLAIEYLGVNGLFANILAFLSLAELGIASAMIYSMYGPVARKEDKKVQVYMSLYKKFYRTIGVIILLLGFSLTPFLNLFFKERPDIPYLELIFILFVINSATSYFYSYKGSIFRADQRQYIVTNNNTIFTFIQAILRIIILVVFKDFILYLVVSVLCVFTQNFMLAKKADKEYPFLKEKPTERLSKEEEKTLYKNVGAMFMQKLGSVVLNASDNIILSKFAGLIVVGLYSNYALIIGIVKSIFNTIADGILPSVGNLCAKETVSHAEKNFNALLLLNIWGIGFCCISLYILLNPFIELWIGIKYTLSYSVVLFSVISLYVQMTMRAAEMFKSATGLFWNDRYIPLIQCLLNILLSVYLVRKYGISGIFIGTTVSMITTSFWITPYIVYKHYFKKHILQYFLRIFWYTCVIVVAGLITNKTSQVTIDNNILAFIFKVLCCIFIPNLIFLAVFFKSKPFGRILYLVGIKKHAKDNIKLKS